MTDVYGEHWVAVLLTSFLVTWSIGLTPPLLIRFVFVRRPLAPGWAIGVVSILWVFNLLLFSMLGSQNQTHGALVLVAFVSFVILSKGATNKQSELETSALTHNTLEPLSLTQNGVLDTASPAGNTRESVDEECIYAQIAEELETGTLDKGLWTRSFAECGGDEKQTKVVYINERAGRLIAAEHARLETIAKEKAAQAKHLEQVQRELAGLADPRLVSAVWDGDWATTRKLLKEGVRPTGVDKNGDSLLTLANKRRDKPMIQLLRAYDAM